MKPWQTGITLIILAFIGQACARNFFAPARPEFTDNDVRMVAQIQCLYGTRQATRQQLRERVAELYEEDPEYYGNLYVAEQFWDENDQERVELLLLNKGCQSVIGYPMGRQFLPQS